MIKKCYLKGSGLEGQGLKRDEKAKVINKTSNTRATELFMATMSDESESDGIDNEHVELNVANRLTSPKCQQTWIVNSGASAHMLLQHDWFKTYQEIRPPQCVWLGDHHYIEAVGKGLITVEMNIGTEKPIRMGFPISLTCT